MEGECSTECVELAYAYETTGKYTEQIAVTFKWLGYPAEALFVVRPCIPRSHSDHKRKPYGVSHIVPEVISPEQLKYQPVGRFVLCPL